MDCMSFSTLLANAATDTADVVCCAGLQRWANVAYLVAAVLFVIGLKGLTHPRTAVRGNMFGAIAMLIATVVTLFLLQKNVSDWEMPNLLWVVLAGLVVGTLIGIVLATKIQMTSMPQLVAAFNGFGGIASVLVAGAALLTTKANDLSLQLAIAVVVSCIIGAITFTGSAIAFGKLQELKIFKKPFALPGQTFINAGLAIAAIGLSVWLVQLSQEGSPDEYLWIYIAICLVSCLLGVLLVTPIGGADMPVVIALLNSYSGLAAAATGFVIDNNLLIIAGSLVGASGLILTKIMCKAMNRSLVNVLFGTMGPTGDGDAPTDDIYDGKIKSTSADEVAMLFDSVERVVIVPGYGLAVAQAQHAVRDLAGLLEEQGVEVEFAIHPVAGRMPGHMNVLLAEAEVDYDKLKEMDVINPTFPQVDVVLVIGANDVVNPLARTDPNSPIAGMPILDVDKARTVVVIKRSLSPGFAGIANPLFAADNCLMFFGDGKQAILDLVAAIKEGR